MLPETLGSVGLLALVAAVAAGWSHIKDFFQRIFGLVVVTVELRSEGTDTVTAFCWEKLRRTPSPFIYFQSSIQFVKPLGRHSHVLYETLGAKGRFFWYGRIPLWLQVKQCNGQATTVIRYLRGTLDADALGHEILTYHRNNVEFDVATLGTRFRVIYVHGVSCKSAYGMPGGMGKGKAGGDEEGISSSNFAENVHPGRLLHWKQEDLGFPQVNKDPIAHLSLGKEATAAVDEILRWHQSRQWHAQRRIPWRRGFLLWGVPGTGKSSFVKAIAQRLNAPIYVFDISTMDNQEFQQHWNKMLAQSPAVALIEDIDSVFEGRENVACSKGTGLTYDCFLNTISGVEATDGLLLFITTNHIEKVDAALASLENGVTSRPGRIDRVVQMPVLDHEGRLKMAKRILSDCHPSWITYLADGGNNDTGAQFEDRCVSKALELYWSGNLQTEAPARK